MDAYTHLDMSMPDPIDNLRRQMASARIDRALIVETWGKDNYSCLERLIASSSQQFRIALCFRPEEGSPAVSALENEMVAALRVKGADIQHLGKWADRLQASGKTLVAHAEAGIKDLKAQLLQLRQIHPNLRIYIPHLGWPRRTKQDDNAWAESMLELSRLPSMIVGISAINEFSRELYPHKDIEPFATRILNAFTPDSIVIGSDYPLLPRGMYGEYMKLAQQWVKRADGHRASVFESSVFGGDEINNP